MTHYDTLGVPKDASKDEIKKAFRRKASKAHPDRNGGDVRVMTALNKAYDTLADDEKRERYDNTGQDGVVESPEMRAVAELCRAIDQVCMSGPEHLDMYSSVRRIMSEKRAGLLQSNQKGVSIIAKLERWRTKAPKRKKKDRAPNLFEQVVTDRVRALKEGMDRNVEVMTMIDDAMKLLQEYEENPTVARPWDPPRFSPGIHFINIS